MPASIALQGFTRRLARQAKQCHSQVSTKISMKNVLAEMWRVRAKASSIDWPVTGPPILSDIDCARGEKQLAAIANRHLVAVEQYWKLADASQRKELECDFSYAVMMERMILLYTHLLPTTLLTGRPGDLWPLPVAAVALTGGLAASGFELRDPEFDIERRVVAVLACGTAREQAKCGRFMAERIVPPGSVPVR